jgi:hypothetical protein
MREDSFTPEKWTRNPSYRRRGGPRVRSGWVRKIFSPRFEPQTIRSVTSRYSDYIILTANWLELILLISIKANKPDFTAVKTGKYELRTVAVVQMWHIWAYFVGSVIYEVWLGSWRLKKMLPPSSWPHLEIRFWIWYNIFLQNLGNTSL